MDMVNQDILNSKVTLESKQGILVIFLNLKCFLVFSAGTNLKTMHETTCCAPGGVVFFITSLLRCVHRPCRTACSKTPEESTKHTRHRLLMHVCMLNPEGCQQIMLEHDLTMQTVHHQYQHFQAPQRRCNLLLWDERFSSSNI